MLLVPNSLAKVGGSIAGIPENAKNTRQIQMKKPGLPVYSVVNSVATNTDRAVTIIPMLI